MENAIELSQEPTAPQEPTLVLRYAQNDDDVVAIHQFLVAVATPSLLAPVDHKDAISEIWRVVNQDVAVMAFLDGVLVGTLGMIRPKWWYSKDHFLTDRWFFVLPQARNSGVGGALIGEAQAIALGSGLDLIINGKFVRRRTEIGRGVVFQSPQVIRYSEQERLSNGADKGNHDVLRHAADPGDDPKLHS